MSGFESTNCLCKTKADEMRGPHVTWPPILKPLEKFALPWPLFTAPSVHRFHYPQCIAPSVHRSLSTLIPQYTAPSVHRTISPPFPLSSVHCFLSSLLPQFTAPSVHRFHFPQCIAPSVHCVPSFTISAYPLFNRISCSRPLSPLL